MPSKCSVTAANMPISPTGTKMSDLQEQLREIKTQLRLSMNGVASTSMREKGLTYKLNFGVELPRIKEIATAYEKNHELAQALWKEDIRECKIMAGLLQPIETFFPEIADIWIENMTHAEIAEHTCKNLFCRLPYAPTISFTWIAGEQELTQYCGYLTLAHLFTKNILLNERYEDEFLDQAIVALQNESSLCRKGAFTALRKYMELGYEQNKKATKQLKALNQNNEKLIFYLEELNLINK